MNTSIFDNKLYVILIMLSLFIAALYVKFCDPDPVKAQDNTALYLAQCIRAECNDCKRYPNEPMATAYVLYKRMLQYNERNTYKRTFAKQIKAYCSVFRSGKKNRRAKRIIRSTFRLPLHGRKHWWKRMKLFTTRFVSDPYSFRDPTPQAMHFGGEEDDYRAKRANWRLVASYSNRFWAMR